MAQAGIHALVGVAVQRVLPYRPWLLLGIILGSMFPDLDNYVVAVATVAGRDTAGLHRTYTHSLFTVAVVIATFFVLARLRQQPRWSHFGLGFGLGIGLHIALDLLLWFNGVELLWPLAGELNLWAGVTPPEWLDKFLEPVELLFFAVYFAWLGRAAKEHQTDSGFAGRLRLWTMGMVGLWLIFTPLAYVMERGFLIIFGAVYLAAITAAFLITIRMRRTVEAVSQHGRATPGGLAAERL
jgi:membrane-bound metal-dependent hydrolase YbcI (DUF457 family)